MSSSILNDVKKAVNVAPDDLDFDLDLLMHINSVFATLNQLGIGLVEGFTVEDAAATWDSFLGTDPRLNFVKTYVYLKVRMLFDPPSTSFLQTSYKEMIQEYEWRINVLRESELSEIITYRNLSILDGGSPSTF